MHAPSREFMIRQAILNYVAANYRLDLLGRSAGRVIGQISVGGTILTGTPHIVAGIRAEFAKIAARYEGCPT